MRVFHIYRAYNKQAQNSKIKNFEDQDNVYIDKIIHTGLFCIGGLLNKTDYCIIRYQKRLTREIYTKNLRYHA